MSFVGALAYADDIVLIAPTPNATLKPLAVCDDFAAQYDIVFNAEKSKFLVVISPNDDLCQMICVHVSCTSTVN